MKKGAIQYDILVWMILGLLILSISLMFIFKEFFTEDELNWEVCRQSILLRSNAIDLGVKDFKDAFPLKCKTEVVEIKDSEPKKIYKKISDIVASGWHLFGEGKFNFVSKNLLEKKAACVVFARAEFSEDVRKKYAREWKKIKEEEGEKNLSREIYKFNEDFVRFYRTEKFPGNPKITYNDYLPLFKTRSKPTSSLVLLSLIVPSDAGLVFIYRIESVAASQGFLGELISGSAAAFLIAGTVMAPLTGGFSIAGVAILSTLAGFANAAHPNLGANFFLDKDYIERASKQRLILVVSGDELSKIEEKFKCTDYLGVLR